MSTATKEGKKHFRAALGLLAVVALFAVPNAFATSVALCPDPLPSNLNTQHQFSAPSQYNAGCYAYGDGNTALSSSPFDLTELERVDKDSDASLLTLVSGSFSSGKNTGFKIGSSVWAEWESIVLQFKTGQGKNDPDWAAFSLSGASADLDDVFTWSYAQGGKNALSHVTLYGWTRIEQAITPVPLPAAAPLFASAILLGGLLARRRLQHA